MATLGWALIQLLWQGALLSGFLAFALWILRGSTSRARYAAGALALAGLAGLPLFSLHAFYAGFSVPNWTCALGLGGLASGVEPHLSWLALLWAVGASIGLVRLLGGVLLTRRLAALATPLPGEVEEEAMDLARRMGVASVRFGRSDRLGSPATVGCFRPTVLLPGSALELLPPTELRAVLAHELAHVRRRDALANLAQSAAEVLLFFHPAAWWISNCVRMEREHCCDDAAASAVCDPRALARALARLETQVAPPRLAVAGTGGLLLCRVRRLLGGVGRAWAPLGPGLRAAILLTALAGAAMAPAEPPAPTVAENSVETEDSSMMPVRAIVLRLRLPAQNPIGEMPLGFDPWPNLFRVARWLLQPGGVV